MLNRCKHGVGAQKPGAGAVNAVHVAAAGHACCPGAAPWLLPRWIHAWPSKCYVYQVAAQLIAAKINVAKGAALATPLADPVAA